MAQEVYQGQRSARTGGGFPEYSPPGTNNRQLRGFERLRRPDWSGKVRGTGTPSGMFRREQSSRVRSPRSRTVGSPLVERVASLMSGSVMSGSPSLFAAMSPLPEFVYWVLGVVVLVILVSELAGARYIANNRVGIVEKLWSFKGSVPEGAHHRPGRRGRVPGRSAPRRLAFRLVAVAVPHSQDCRWSRFRRARSAIVYARDGEALLPSQTLGKVIPCNNFQDARRFLGGETTGPDQEPVVGQRGRQRAILREGVYAINLALFTVITEDTVYRLETGGSKELKALVNWQNELSENDGFSPVIIGGPVEAPDPLNPGEDDDGRQHRDRDGPRRSVAAARRDHRAGGRRTTATTRTSTTTSRTPRRSSARRPPRLAICPADRRHLLHQPLVRQHRIDPQDDRADRLCRRGGQLLRPERQRPLGPGVPPRRAGRRRRARRPGEAARTGQVCLQHLCRQHRPGADDQLRAALGDRPDRDASLRREPALDRPGHQGRLRADLAAVGRRPHRLSEGPQRHSAVRRRQEADHADPRPDAQRLLPRRGAQADDARAAPGPRFDPARVEQRAGPEVPQLRHRMRRRPDRQAGHRAGRRQDRDAAGAVAAAAALARAGGDLFRSRSPRPRTCAC